MVRLRISRGFIFMLITVRICQRYLGGTSSKKGLICMSDDGSKRNQTCRGQGGNAKELLSWQCNVKAPSKTKIESEHKIPQEGCTGKMLIVSVPRKGGRLGVEPGCRREPDFFVTRFLYYLSFVRCICIIDFKNIIYSLACQKTS